MALTKKQQVFIETYLTCWNATESARLAGYAFPNVEGTRLLVNASIKEQIEARLAEMKMSADEVLTRLAEQARADMAEFVKFQDGVKLPFLDLKGAADKGLLRLVKKFKYNTAGQPEIELYDAQAALVHIGKQNGLFSDRHVIEMRLEKEIDSILDTLEGILPPELYSNVLAAISGPAAGGETSTESQSIGSE